VQQVHPGSDVHRSKKREYPRFIKLADNFADEANVFSGV
jgi:hypothetical protein